MLKLKIAPQETKISYLFYAVQVHDKFLLCFNSSLILVESYNFLTSLVSCSTKHFPRNLINLFHISESLRLELRWEPPFPVNIEYFSHYMLSTSIFLIFFFRFVYFNNYKLQMSLISLQFIFQG